MIRRKREVLPLSSYPYNDCYTGPYWSDGQFQESVVQGTCIPVSILDQQSRLHDTCFALGVQSISTCDELYYQNTRSLDKFGRFIGALPKLAHAPKLRGAGGRGRVGDKMTQPTPAQAAGGQPSTYNGRTVTLSARDSFGYTPGQVPIMVSGQTPSTFPDETGTYLPDGTCAAPAPIFTKQYNPETTDGAPFEDVVAPTFEITRAGEQVQTQPGVTTSVYCPQAFGMNNTLKWSKQRKRKRNRRRRSK